MLLTQLIDQPFGLTNSQKTLKRQKRKSNVERTSTEEHTRISPERFLGQHVASSFSDHQIEREISPRKWCSRLPGSVVHDLSTVPTVAPSHEARVPLTETFTSSTDSKIRDGAKYEESDTRRRMSPNSGPKRLRELLEQPGIIRSLGAHDVFTALIVEQAGFETVFIGGFGTSASMLGLPDLNFLTMSEMAEAVRRMATRVCIPVIADGDTGYGDLHNVQRTVEAFEAAGASGILLEDQVMPKRCGHFANKRVIPSEEMVLKIKAAVKAKSDPDFVIFARTDARQMNGLDDAIDRVNRCCDSGADIAFIEAPESRAELEEIPKRVKHPLFVNMLTGGVTPILSVKELEQLGYKIVVCPIESLMVCARAMRDLCEAWKNTGRVDKLATQAMSFAEVKKLLGVEEFLKLRERL
jgi:2,3-dimethylmalate lyase